MGVTLVLEGRLAATDPRATLERARAWLEAQTMDPAPRIEIGDEPSTLLADLHPAAEPLEIVLVEGRLEARAKTSTAGPGYHRHVCALLAGLGDALGVAWERAEDETGWWKRRDPSELEEAFLDWLGAAVAQIRELSSGGARGFALALPAGHVFEHEGVVATPLGPRDATWLAQVLEDPRVGVDAFPAWDEHGSAGWLRGLALTLLWTEVRFRPPLDDGERALLDRIVTWVERAHGLDPSIALPWQEQSELCELLSEESLRATRAHVRAQGLAPRARLGYRRRNVSVTLSGGWRMTIPGELAERWEERGTFVAWDEGRSVWFTSLTVHGEDGAPSPDTAATLAGLPPLEGDEVLELERGPIRGYAAFRREDTGGAPHHRLEAHAALAHHAAVGTVVFVEDADRDWALRTWASLAR